MGEVFSCVGRPNAPDRYNVWHSFNPLHQDLARSGQYESDCDCDCDCDCACAGAYTNWSGGLSAGAGGYPAETLLKLSRNVHMQIEGDYAYFIPPRSPGVMVCESKALDRILSGHVDTTGMERLAAYLANVGILTRNPAEESFRPEVHKELMSVWISLSEACSLACPYCYVRHRPLAMSKETAAQAVEAVFRSAKRHGYRRLKVKYAGGEPTLNFKALEAAQEHAERLSKESGIHLESVLLTNGIRLTAGMIRYVVEHRIEVMVSLDGVGEVQDRSRPRVGGGSSFERVSATIRRLQQAGISPQISVTLTSANIDGLPELVRYLLDNEVHFSLNFYRSMDLSDPLFIEPQKLTEGLRRAYGVIEERLPSYSFLGGLADRANLLNPHACTCLAGDSYLVIAADGQIANCQMNLEHTATSVKAEDPLGDLLKMPGARVNRPVWEKDCKDCTFASRCTGGCPLLAFQESGRFEAASPYCQVYQQILPDVVRLEALRLLRYVKPVEFAG